MNLNIFKRAKRITAAPPPLDEFVPIRPEPFSAWLQRQNATKADVLTSLEHFCTWIGKNGYTEADNNTGAAWRLFDLYINSREDFDSHAIARVASFSGPGSTVLVLLPPQEQITDAKQIIIGRINALSECKEPITLADFMAGKDHQDMRLSPREIYQQGQLPSLSCPTALESESQPISPDELRVELERKPILIDDLLQHSEDNPLFVAIFDPRIPSGADCFYDPRITVRAKPCYPRICSREALLASMQLIK